jgi:hypothetical protein
MQNMINRYKLFLNCGWLLKNVFYQVWYTVARLKVLSSEMDLAESKFKL